VYGAGDCRESNFCSGRGNCTDGLCVCPSGYIDSNCSVSVDCKYFDEDSRVWRTDGVLSVLSSDGRSLRCETTHLTTFGGVIEIPTSADELLAELETAFHFNVFTLDEAGAILSNFSIADNPTIMTIVFTLSALNLFSLTCLGWWRGSRARRRRRRENKMYEREVIEDELHALNTRLAAVEAADAAKKGSATTRRGLFTKKLSFKRKPSFTMRPPLTKTLSFTTSSAVAPQTSTLTRQTSFVPSSFVRQPTQSFVPKAFMPKSSFMQRRADAARVAPAPPEAASLPPSPPLSPDEDSEHSPTGAKAFALKKYNSRKKLQRWEEIERMKAARRSLRASEQSMTKIEKRINHYWASSHAFCNRLVRTLRAEHTVINLFSPPDDEEALTQVQMVQLFWNTIATELFVCAFMYQSDGGSGAAAGGGGRKAGGGGGGGIAATSSSTSATSQYSDSLVLSPVTAFTEGLIAASICMVVISICAYVFRIGNSHRRPERNVFRRWIRQMRIFFGRFCLSCKPAEKEVTKARRRLTPPDGMVYVEEEYLSYFGRICCYAWLGCPGVAPLVYRCCRSTRVKLVAIEDAEQDAHARTSKMGDRGGDIIAKRPGTAEESSCSVVGADNGSDNASSGSNSQANGTRSAWQEKVPDVDVPAVLEMVRDTKGDDDGTPGSTMGPAVHSPVAEQQRDSTSTLNQLESATSEEPMMLLAPSSAEPAEAAAAPAPSFSSTSDGLDAKNPDDCRRPSTGSDSPHVIKGHRVKSCIALRPANVCTEQHVPERPHTAGPDMKSSSRDSTALLERVEDVGVDDEVQAIGGANESTLSQIVTSPPASPPPEHLSASDPSSGVLFRSAPRLHIAADTSEQAERVATPQAEREASVQAERKEETLLETRARAAALNRMAMLGECANSAEMRDFMQMRDLEKAKERDQRGREMREASKGPAKDQKGLQRRLLWQPKQTSSSIAAIAIEAQLHKVRKDLRWRGPRERACRIGAAWAFNLTVSALAYLVSIIFCARFGEKETSAMSVSWMIAYGLTFVLIEPAQVLLLASAPCLFDDSTKVGRCCLRVRLVYNELCAP